jgi:ABC-type transport system involved in cytochrome bd biosynthesis fused ATPase/permease subunit
VLSLCVAIGAVQAFSLGRGLARYLQRIGVHGLSLSMLGRLRLHLYDTVVPLVPGALGVNGSGEVLSGFVSDTELVAEGFARSATATVDVTASIGFGTLLATLTEPLLGAVVLAGGLVVVIVSFLLARFGRSLEMRTAVERAELAGSVVQTVLSARELVAFGRQDLVARRLEEVRRRSASLAARRAVASGAARAGVVVAGGGAVMAVTGAGLALCDAHRISGVMLAVVAFATLAVVDQCSNLPAVLAGSVSAGVATARLRRLDNIAPLVVEPVVEPGGDRSTDAARGAADLVGAQTRGIDGSAVLKDLSFCIDPGEHVALVGPNGSGKTTAVLALLHFVACSGGQARLGGIDVSTLTREGIASLAGWVPDETHVFAASLGENLRLGRPAAADDECWAVLAQAGLAEWARALPDGLSTGMGAGGRQVSAGERQRLGLARVLLAGSPLLFLDEPTAHLDAATAGQVLPELLDAAGNRSVLVVSHDPAIAQRVDRVVALEAGRVSGVSRGGRRPRSQEEP